MGRTQLTTREIGSVQRNDLDTTTAGQAVVTRIIAGTNVSLSSTGVDTGTGDVTINASGGGGFGVANIAAANVTLATDTGVVIPSIYTISSTFTLTLAGTSIFGIY